MIVPLRASNVTSLAAATTAVFVPALTQVSSNPDRPKSAGHFADPTHWWLRRVVAALGMLVLLASSAAAQLQFAELRKRQLPTDKDLTSAVALADVDGDGDPDLVLGNSLGQNRLHLNDGTGIFTDATAARMPADSDYTTAVALGDVDGDGDLDVVLGNSYAFPGLQNRLYLNDGTGTFTDATSARMPADSDHTAAVALGDVDADGDLDLVFGNYFFEQNRLYLNDGTGNFTDVTAARMPPDSDDTEAVALGDVDGDGDLDLVFGNGGQNRLYSNDGTGAFTDATAFRMPTDLDGTSAAALGDLDGDGDLDLVLGNTSSPGQQNRLYLNDGTGTFTDATAARMPADRDSTSAVALVDVDGDGDLDLAWGNFGFPGQQNRLYLNDGTGTFTDATAARMPADRDSTYAVAPGDVDGDGDLDLIFGSWQHQNRLYLDDGTGTFNDATASRMPANDDSSAAVALGDVDGDGDADLVFGNGDLVREQNRLYLNGGAGTFIDATAARMPATIDYTSAALLGDVDGDGDLDLVFGNGQQNRLLLNDGTGTFTDATAARMPIDSDWTYALALGDVDGDGDPDLVLGTGYSGQNRLYLNDGTGNFTDVTASRMPTDSDDTWAVALGDVDGDGDLDLLFGNAAYPRYQSQNRFYLNDGTGTFTDATATRMPTDFDDTSAVALGDVDGDGDADMVLASGGRGGRPQQNRLYLNDGTGIFTDATAARMPAALDVTWAVVLGDVDGDSDADLVFGNVGPTAPIRQNRLLLNDGTGTFTDATAMHMPADADATSAVALGDVDGDGDPDLAFGNLRGEHNRLFLNLTRQLDTPFVVVPGREYRLDVYSRYGPPRLLDFAVPFVSMKTARIPLPPYGTIGLDPALMIPLLPVVVPQPAGVGSVTATIPHNPSLVGRSIHAQAMLLHWPGPAYLTNVTTDRIVR